MWNDKCCVDPKIFFFTVIEILLFLWLKGNYGSFWVDLNIGEFFICEKVSGHLGCLESVVTSNQECYIYKILKITGIISGRSWEWIWRFKKYVHRIYSNSNENGWDGKWRERRKGTKKRPWEHLYIGNGKGDNFNGQQICSTEETYMCGAASL